MNPKKALSVRSKILIALCISMLVLCVALLGASFLVIQSGFTKLEQDAMQKDLSRLTDELTNSVNQQLVKLKDWSTWDDSYEFGAGKNPGFVEKNLPDSALTNLDIEFVAYFDTDGKLIFAKEIDHASGESASTTDALAAIASDPLLTKRDSFGSRIGGFVALPQAPLMVGSLPLLKNDGTGPSTGSMIFGRYLDATRVQALGDLLHLSVDAFPYAATDLPPDVAAAKARFSVGALTYITPLSESSIAGYTILKDIHGTPILLLRITEPRPVHAQGNVSIFTFYAAGGASLLLFGIIMLLLIDRLVIARFVRLTANVEKINEGHDLASRLDGGEMDEIGRLAEKINQMLTWLSQAKEGEAASRREIVNLLNDLKQEKEQSEEMAQILKNKNEGK